jgi:hypothetical protein
MALRAYGCRRSPANDFIAAAGEVRSYPAAEEEPMSEALDDERPGLLGPWRRWRSWTPRERVVLGAMMVLSGVFAGAAWFWLGRLWDDGGGVGGAVFFAVAIVLVRVYEPELVHLWRTADAGP